MTYRVNKARYWTAVLYPENMVAGWEQKIGDLVQVPFAYALHSSDVDLKSEHRKDHIHLILAFSNTTTYKHALGVFKLLGEKAVNHCEAVINIRHCYDYLIHDTETARKQGKELYSPDARITGNNFDIGSYEQISTADKKRMLKDLCDYIIEMKICNLADFYIGAMQNFDDEYFEVISTHNAMLDRLTRGNFLKYQNARVAEQHTEQDEKCPYCGSTDVKKNGRTAGQMQRFVCKECGKSYC